ncbi:hypothetical protein IAI10_16380 [Clostridium sp. 19966]|uniref:COG1470 family protein n=1 Tax=Clostridium sp. 19966 TaxID=2768166 RepID=UPI0028E05D0C|nr:hypothetical protein [Clostridium sp. 19966]MDT8718245.1 hypothetical protein [Clostridium sp. 19966]
MKRINTILVGIMSLMVIIPSYVAKADTLKLGASPTIINNLKIEKGKSLDSEITIANESEFSKAEGQNGIDKYSYKVHLEAIENTNKFNNIQDSSRNNVMASKWINFKENDISLAPGEEKSIKFTVNVPENVDIGEYKPIINITEVPIEKSSAKVNINLSSLLQVPVFIDVQDPILKTDGLKESYEIKDFIVTDDLKDSQSFISLITKSFSNDAIKLKRGDKTIYDVFRNEKISLNNVITNDKSKLSDSKYILIPAALSQSSLIDRIDFSEKNLIIVSDGNKYTIETPSTDFADNLKSQITKLSTESTEKPSIGLLFGELKVNKNKSSQEHDLFFKYTIKNTGTKTIIPNGKLNIVDNGNIEGQVLYSSTVISPGETKDVIACLDYSNMSIDNKDYNIQSIIVPYEGANPIILANSITFMGIRKYIILGVLLVAAAVILTVVFFIRKIRSKNHKISIAS